MASMGEQYVAFNKYLSQTDEISIPTIAFL